MVSYLLIVVFALIIFGFFRSIIKGSKSLIKDSNDFIIHFEKNFDGSPLDSSSVFQYRQIEIDAFNKKIKRLNGEYVLIAKPEELLKPSNILYTNYQYFLKVNSYPQLCMGLGILGTFIGLSFGLSKLTGDLTDSNLLLQKVEGLIGGMSLAFGTSLIGMLASIVGSYIVNKTKSLVNEDFKRIYTFVYKKLPIIDPMEYFFSMEKAEKGNDEVVHLRAIDFMSRNLEVNTETATATISMNNDLATSISNGISDNISPTLQSLNESIDGFVSDNKNGAQDAISMIIMNLEQSMKDMVGQFKDMISEDTKNELEAMANMLSESGDYFVKIPEVLESILQQIEEQQNQQRDHYQEINTNLDESLENFNGEVDRYNETLQKFDAVQQQFSSSLYQYDQFLKTEQDTYNLIDNSFLKFNNIMEKTQILMSEINSLGGDLGNIFRTLHSNVHQYEQEVGSSLNTYLDGYSKAIDEFTYRMETAVNGLQSLLDDINDQDLVKN